MPKNYVLNPLFIQYFCARISKRLFVKKIDTFKANKIST